MKSTEILSASLVKWAADGLTDGQVLQAVGANASANAPARGMNNLLIGGGIGAALGGTTGLFAQPGNRMRTVLRNALIGAALGGVPSAAYGLGASQGFGAGLQGAGSAVDNAEQMDAIRQDVLKWLPAGDKPT